MLFSAANTSSIHPLDYRTLPDITEFSLQQDQLRNEVLSTFVLGHYCMFLCPSSMYRCRMAYLLMVCHHRLL